MTTPLRIPLLRDRHNHPFLYAAFREGVDLMDVATHDEAIGRIRARATTQDAGWTIAFGWNSGRYQLDKHEFDDLPPLVVFNLSLHGLIVNDAGRAVFQRHHPDLIGHLDDLCRVERNLRAVLNVFAQRGASPERLCRFFQWMLQEHGVYHAEELLLVDESEVHLFDSAGLSDRTRFWAAPELYQRMPRSLQARIHGIKIFSDGALGVRTAALHQPYRDSPQTGMLMYEPAELKSLLQPYLAGGTPVAVHAIGDRAIDQVVSAIESVDRSTSSEIRIEHAQLISEATARRAKHLGIQLCMQPNFSADSVCYADRLPTGYSERNNPFRMLIDRVGYVPGQDLWFGSDGMPHGVREALRQSLFPDSRNPGQVLTIEEFVAGYCMPDDSKGHIEVEIDAARRCVTCQVAVG